MLNKFRFQKNTNPTPLWWKARSWLNRTWILSFGGLLFQLKVWIGLGLNLNLIKMAGVQTYLYMIWYDLGNLEPSYTIKLAQYIWLKDKSQEGWRRCIWHFFHGVNWISLYEKQSAWLSQKINPYLILKVKQPKKMKNILLYPYILKNKKIKTSKTK